MLTRRHFAALPLGLGAASLAQAAPSRRWTIFVIQHSHIDIGYTERQEIITDQHAQFVSQALRMALSPAQKKRDPDTRFKFTMEGFWQVEQFLNRASAEDRRRLVGAIREGVMELTAAYFHMTEMPDQDLLRASISYAAAFARQEKLPLTVAMECDINGLSWGMADAYIERGVRYLSMNINPHHGAYPVGGPFVPFFWQAPSGKRLLAWCGMAYHKANLFGLMGNTVPDGDPGVPGFRISGPGGWADVKDISLAERKFLPLLAWLEQSGYRHNFFPIMGSGVYTDNGAPGEEYCGIIQQWNQKHGDKVHIRTATLAEFFAHLEKNSAELPTYRGEWTDWWSDGAASTPVDTILFRNAQRTRRLIDRLDPGAKVVSNQQRTQIDKKLLFAAEHTFGYSRTLDSDLLMQQVFTRKSKHAIDADELAGTAIFSILRKRGEGESADRRPLEFKALNPLDTAVRAPVPLVLNSWEQPTLRAGFRVVDGKGNVYPHQTEGIARGAKTTVVAQLAPGEERSFKLVPAAPVSGKPRAGTSFENKFYKVEWQAERGIVALQDAAGRSVLDSAREPLGCPIYQVFPGGVRNKAGAVVPPRTRPRDEVTAGKCTRIRCAVAGDVYERWEFDYDVPGATRYTLAATFYRELPQIELTATLHKTDVRDPEGMYIIFPFSVPGGLWTLDKPGAPMRPGRDQLPQACCDYYCLQHGAALTGNGLGVAMAILDAPLVHIGKMRLWDYSTSIEPVGPIYSWLCNNKWETNFRISCGGAYDFRYVVQVGGDLADPNKALALCRSLSYPPLVMRG